MNELFVISVWKNRADEEFTRIRPVADEERAERIAAEYRKLSEGSSTKVEEIILVQGKRL